MSKKNFAISILGLVGLMGTAWGGTVVYCNEVGDCGSHTQAAFATATSPLDFDLVAFSNGTYDAGLLNAGSVAGLDFYSYNSSNAQEGVTVAGGVLDQNAGSATPNALEIELPGGVYAFSAMISVVSGSAVPCVELISSPPVTGGSCNGGYQFSISSSSDSEFVGIVSSTPLSDVFIGSYNLGGGAITLTDFELGQQAAPTPEMGTMVLIGTGLILLRFIQRRRRRFLM